MANVVCSMVCPGTRAGWRAYSSNPVCAISHVPLIARCRHAPFRSGEHASTWGGNCADQRLNPNGAPFPVADGGHASLGVCRLRGHFEAKGMIEMSRRSITAKEMGARFGRSSGQPREALSQSDGADGTWLPRSRIGCGKLAKKVQPPSLQRDNFFAAREQPMPNDVHGSCKPDLRLLLGGFSVEWLCVHQISLPLSGSNWAQLRRVAEDGDSRADSEAGECNGKPRATSARAFHSLNDRILLALTHLGPGLDGWERRGNSEHEHLRVRITR
jgi:hypothetical protein